MEETVLSNPNPPLLFWGTEQDRIQQDHKGIFASARERFKRIKDNSGFYFEIQYTKVHFKISVYIHI